MLEWLFEPETWIALVTLTALEVVLGVDNIIGKQISGGALILIGGGLFLLWKSVHEIHSSLAPERDRM